MNAGNPAADSSAKDFFMKRTIARLIIIALLSSVFLPLSSEEKTGSAVVEEMDSRMNFTECRMVIRIEDTKADGKKRTLKAGVDYLKDVGTRMDFLEPVRDKGKSVLMSGSSMWMSSPSVSKPVRLSGKDAFMGTSFTNDDMMNLDKNDDYDSVIASSDGEGWTVVMTAKNASVPWSKIEARIGADYLPVRMTYFARSGKESKRVEFSLARDFGGKMRPSVMTIVDLMKSGDSSSVVFEEIREESVNRSRLTPASLGN